MIAWPHIWIPTISEGDSDSSAKRRANRQEALVTLN